MTAGFGRDAAHAEWFYGFRLGLRTDLGSRIVRAWETTLAAVDERVVAADLLDGDWHPVRLLCDRGFTGRAFTASQAERGTRIVLAPSRTPNAIPNRQPGCTRSRCCATGSRPPTAKSPKPRAGPPPRPHLLGTADPHRSHPLRPRK
ncbi:hypothetical protein [Nocardia arthritidis]|uniref:hypothetical protein n=1 Tax=Nocardia arthritidis TaxID=228602 RepID=UPI003D1604D4